MGVHKSPCVLFIGHDRELTVRCEMLLKHLGYRVVCVENSDETRSIRAAASCTHAVFIDASPGGDPNGLTVLNEIRSVDSAIPIVMISGRPNSMDVVRAMKSGATNFLFGEVSANDLRRALEIRALPSRCPRPPFSTVAKHVLFGESPRIREVRAIIEQLHWSDAPVFIRGERGTGKSVIAREVHAHSARAGTRFFKLDCSGLKSDRLEAALFGSQLQPDRGYRTRTPGLFENGARGSLLLEEIGEMDLSIQARLLTMLRDSSFQRIGAPQPARVDLRLIATTSADVEKAVGDGRLSSELYEYLKAISIELPPLRDHAQDILPLTESLIKTYARAAAEPPVITQDVKDTIATYHWPGNVRELKSFARAVVHLRDARAAARELRPLQIRQSAGMYESN